MASEEPTASASYEANLPVEAEAVDYNDNDSAFDGVSCVGQ